MDVTKEDTKLVGVWTAQREKDKSLTGTFQLFGRFYALKEIIRRSSAHCLHNARSNKLS